jgi:hypothetical protein
MPSDTERLSLLMEVAEAADKIDFVDQVRMDPDVRRLVATLDACRAAGIFDKEEGE